jgi:two-component system, OmpR family, sensor histidine kinase ChvG
VAQGSSSLTRRIVLLNVAGLLALVVSILYLSQYRAGLIDARVQSLLVQGEIIASAIAASATVETDSITIDPDKLLELQAGESYGPQDESLSALEFPINLERVAPILRRLIQPTRTQARIYDREGALQIDSRNLYGRGDVLRFDIVPVDDRPTRLERAWIAIKNWFGRSSYPLYRDLGPANGKGYPEVVQALAGQKASTVRVNERGEIIVLVGVPIQRFRAVRGALLLSTQGGEIDDAVASERLQVLALFLALGAVMVLLSMLLARTIAEPVRRLADAAENVRQRITSRGEIPDFTYRRDEIGELSGALREMTNSLYSRIEAIESFAADVAHELKNPLTSLRSAVETMPLAKTPESRARLLAVIQHDVKRLDRLISDVSLQRQDVAPVDLTRLLRTVVGVANEVRRGDGVKITLAFEGGPPRAFTVRGHDSRLGQVIDNLIENARSFSPQGGIVRITAKRLRNAVEITVDDDGPGIQPEAIERIFERFYTDRPHQGFGQNSGLGLSISRQIVEAHGGRIRAENRIGVSDEPDGPKVLGARFVVRLPAS